MPHLVIICPGCGMSGAVANVALQHARVLANTFHITLVSDALPVAEVSGVECIAVGAPSFAFLRRYGHVPREIAFSRSVLRQLRQLHRRRRVDLVLCHGHVIASLSARPFGIKTGIPYVMITHGDIFDRPKGTYDARLTWLYKKVTPTAYRQAALVVVLSPHMAVLAQKGGAQPGNVVLIPNGIDSREIGLDDMYDETAGLPRDDTLELLYVGRLSIEKGIDILIESCGMLKRSGISFRLRLAGEGPQRTEIVRRVEELALTDEVFLLGRVERQDLGTLYRSADLVCVPSRSDTLPTVVLESLLAGTAVVGSDAGGIPHMLCNQDVGWVVEKCTPQSLAATIAEISTDPTRLTAVGLNGSEYVKREFTWDKAGQKLSAELLRLVA